MSLFTTLQLASNSLTAQQIGLQVVGQNIANVNTPGYSREVANMSSLATQRSGNLLLGLGVHVDSVKQVADENLNARLRSAVSDRSGGDVQESTYQQLQSIIGELQDTDLSTSMNRFFSSISQVLNQPQDTSTRNLAVLQGQTLAGDISRLAERAMTIRNDLNQEVAGVVPDVNRLLSRIADLNVQITTIEGGGVGGSQAVGLRDERNKALTELSELIDIKTQAQDSGAINVFADGDYLVFEGNFRQIHVAYSASEDGEPTANLQLDELNSPIRVTSGKAAALVTARDEIVGGFMNSLNDYAKTLSFEFNKLFSSGQGLSGYSQLTSQTPVTTTNLPLDAIGLPSTPVNGGFDVLIRDKQTGLTTTTHVPVDLNGLDDNDITYEQLVEKLDGVAGMSATIDLNGRVVLKADSANVEFSFGNDTSGTLAALGINTFFTGTSAASLGVNAVLLKDPTKFAASSSGIGGDTANAAALAGFLDRPLDTADGKTINQVYGAMIDRVVQGASVSSAVAEGYRSFEATLKGQQLAVSGVNLDEEAVMMMSYQRAYQASARIIKAISELLDVITSL